MGNYVIAAIFIAGFLLGRLSKKTVKLERISEEEYNRIKETENKDSVGKIDLDN